MRQATPLSRPRRLASVWLWPNNLDYREEECHPSQWPTLPVSVLLLPPPRHPLLQVPPGNGKPQCQSRQSAVAAGSAFGRRPGRSRRSHGAQVRRREKTERIWAETEGAELQAPPSSARDERQADQRWRTGAEKKRTRSKRW